MPAVGDIICVSVVVYMSNDVADTKRTEKHHLAFLLQ